MLSDSTRVFLTSVPNAPAITRALFLPSFPLGIGTLFAPPFTRPSWREQSRRVISQVQSQAYCGIALCAAPCFLSREAICPHPLQHPRPLQRPASCTPLVPSYRQVFGNLRDTMC